MQKVLIANRGEIAVRIIRACRDYGLKSVAVYADADSDAPFVQMADEAYALNGNSPAETYLDHNKILKIAKAAQADAIHPGYGFLSEQAEFAQAVVDADLIWIGPQADVIEKLGDKVEARQIAKDVGAPLAAGSDGAISSAEEVITFASQYGYPIAIKAAHGGGGRGMKVVWREDDVQNLYESAVRESTAAFGRGECYVEQYLDQPRHIETQVIADKFGNVIVVGTRDCSLQRRNQKLIEEAPAPFLTPAQNQAIEEASIAIFKHVGYCGVGTVEFLLGANGVVSFLEVNTRLQVEHPVTEETSGLDLVVEQFRIAEGRPLSIDAKPLVSNHAIEFRINAEDIGRGFLPSAGEITKFKIPTGPGVRIDSGVEQGTIIAPMFDSMMAKLIVTGKDRAHAIARARRALKEFEIEGVATVLEFHRQVLEHEDFVNETHLNVHTRWIETSFMDNFDMQERPVPVHASMQRVAIEIDGKQVQLGLSPAFLKLFSQSAVSLAPDNDGDAQDTIDENAITAPVPGILRNWQVEDQAQVTAGDQLGVMEAMKMETPIVAHKSGIVTLIAQEGASLQHNAVIARIEDDKK